MTHILEDGSRSIGATPLVRLNRVAGRLATVLAKLEERNPTGSVKSRIAAGLVWDAEKQGSLRSGLEILEPTGANMGVALASVAAARGYRVTLVVPETTPKDRRRVMLSLGATVIVTPRAEGMRGAILRAEQMALSAPDRWFVPMHFNNPANPAIHERTTGPEIWTDTGGAVDVLVAGVGTGGTISGVSRYLKNARGRSVLSVAVEPEESPVISQRLAGAELRAGVGVGFVPETLDLNLIDRVERVSGEEALEFARRLAREEGLPAGVSSGAAGAVAARLAREPEFTGKTIVVIFPDGSERNLSSPLFNGVDE
jgi:cysteine synthase A